MAYPSMATASLPPTYPRKLPRGCVGYYDFCERGDKILDHSGFKNHGAITTAVRTPVGLTFDGDDYVTIGNINQVIRTIQLVFYNNNALTKAMTLEVPMQLNSNAVVAWGNWTGSLTNEIITFGSGGNLGGWCDATASVTAGWHVLDIVWNGTYYGITLDGTAKTATTIGTPAVITASLVELGRRSTGANYFSGQVGFFVLSVVSLATDELKSNRDMIKAELIARGATGMMF